MPIRAILETEYGPVFGPEDVAAVAAAFEAALSKLGLVDRHDPLTTAIAKLVIQLAKDGERDPEKLCDTALQISEPNTCPYRKPKTADRGRESADTRCR